MDQSTTHSKLQSLPVSVRRRKEKWFRKDFQLYLLLVLPIMYFIVFKYVPMYGAAIAFQDYSIFQG